MVGPIPENEVPRLRVGILGVATITRKNAHAILDRNSGCEVTVVASRSEQKAKVRALYDFCREN